MNKYNHTPLLLKPQIGVNTAHSDKDMTARKRQDGFKSSYGYYNHTLPVILLIAMMVSCSPAHAMTNQLYGLPTPSNDHQMKKPLTSDEYTLEVIQWVEKSSSSHHTGLCEIARNGETIKLNQSVPTYYSTRIAHEIVLHLETVTEDEYSIINHQPQGKPVSELIYTSVSYTDEREG